jgi:hypothetical protein
MTDKRAPIREMSDYHEMVAERRRYALLQAAAAVFASSHDPDCQHTSGQVECGNAEAASVTIAEALLAEIESREKDGGNAHDGWRDQQTVRRTAGAHAR